MGRGKGEAQNRWRKKRKSKGNNEPKPIEKRRVRGKTRPRTHRPRSWNGSPYRSRKSLDPGKAHPVGRNPPRRGRIGINCLFVFLYFFVSVKIATLVICLPYYGVDISRVEAFYREYSAPIINEAIEALKWHLKEGHFVCTITTSPTFYFEQKLNFV